MFSLLRIANQGESNDVYLCICICISVIHICVFEFWLDVNLGGTAEMFLEQMKHNSLDRFCCQCACVHNYFLSSFISRFLASLLVEVGEYDISGPNEMMSTKEMKVIVTSILIFAQKR